MKKTDNSVLVHQNELAMSYYGITEIIWNKFLDFLFKLFSQKRNQQCSFKTWANIKLVNIEH